MNEILHVSKGARFPEARSGDHQQNLDVLNQEQQNAWDHYLESRRIAGSYYQGPERRSPTSKIDREIFGLAGMTRNSSGSKECDILLNEYQSYAPTSLAEARDGQIGLQRRINIAANTKDESIEPDKLDRVRENAVVKRVSDSQGYLIDAAHDLDALQKIMKNPDNEDSKPDPGLFRISEEAQQVVVKQLLFRDILWGKYENQWPSKNSNIFKEREKHYHGLVIEATKSASNEALSHLLEIFYDRAVARFKFLNREYSKAQRMPIVNSLIEKGKLVPITAGKLLSAKYDREWRAEDAEQLTEPPHGTLKHDSMLSPTARDAIADKKRRDEILAKLINSEYDYEYEVLERSMHYQPPEIRAALAIRGLARAISPEAQFEADEEAELAEISERARQSKPPAKKKHRLRFRGSRESGPSSKRKETDYR